MVARHSTPFDFVFLQNLGGQSQVKNPCVWGHRCHLADIGRGFTSPCRVQCLLLTQSGHAVGETTIKTNKVCQMTRRNEDLYHPLILHWKSTVRKNL